MYQTSWFLFLWIYAGSNAWTKICHCKTSINKYRIINVVQSHSFCSGMDRNLNRTCLLRKGCQLLFYWLSSTGVKSDASWVCYVNTTFHRFLSIFVLSRTVLSLLATGIYVLYIFMFWCMITLLLNLHKRGVCGEMSGFSWLPCHFQTVLIQVILVAA